MVCAAQFAPEAANEAYRNEVHLSFHCSCLKLLDRSHPSPSCFHPPPRAIFFLAVLALAAGHDDPSAGDGSNLDSFQAVLEVKQAAGPKYFPLGPPHGCSFLSWQTRRSGVTLEKMRSSRCHMIALSALPARNLRPFLCLMDPYGACGLAGKRPPRRACCKEPAACVRAHQ